MPEHRVTDEGLLPETAVWPICHTNIITALKGSQFSLLFVRRNNYVKQWLRQKVVVLHEADSLLNRYLMYLVNPVRRGMLFCMCITASRQKYVVLHEADSLTICLSHSFE